MNDAWRMAVRRASGKTVVEKEPRVEIVSWCFEPSTNSLLALKQRPYLPWQLWRLFSL